MFKQRKSFDFVRKENADGKAGGVFIRIPDLTKTIRIDSLPTQHTDRNILLMSSAQSTSSEGRSSCEMDMKKLSSLMSKAKLSEEVSSVEKSQSQEHDSCSVSSMESRSTIYYSDDVSPKTKQGFYLLKFLTCGVFSKKPWRSRSTNCKSLNNVYDDAGLNVEEDVLSSVASFACSSDRAWSCSESLCKDLLHTCNYVPTKYPSI